MTWHVEVARRAKKFLEPAPARDRGRLLAALEQMRQDPFSGDVARLRSERTAYRRRVGSYRIFFDVYPGRLWVDVVEIARRTSTTY